MAKSATVTKLKASTSNQIGDMASIEAHIKALGEGYAAGMKSREDAMIYMAQCVEQDKFNVGSGAKADNTVFDGLFNLFRTGKKATPASDAPLRSKFLKVCLAAQTTRGNVVKFTDTLNKVSAEHSTLNKAKLAAKKEDKVVAPFQRIEAFYKAAQEQADVVKDGTPLDDDAIYAATANVKDDDTRSDAQKIADILQDMSDKLKPLLGDEKGKGVRITPPANLATTLKGIRDNILKAKNSAVAPAAPTTLPAGVTPEAIAAFMAAQAKREAAKAAKASK